MSNGCKAVGDANFLARRRKLVGGLFLCFVLFAGCAIPVSRTTIMPTDVAQTPQHLIAKLDLLEAGMELPQVFQLLDIKATTPGVREVVTAEEKQRILYGSAQLIGSPQDLEQFRLHLSKHRIVEIRFRDIENSLLFDSAVSVLTMKTGPDFISYVIFYDGKLTHVPSKPDNFFQAESTRIYISELFGSMLRVGVGRGVGMIGN